MLKCSNDWISFRISPFALILVHRADLHVIKERKHKAWIEKKITSSVPFQTLNSNFILMLNDRQFDSTKYKITFQGNLVYMREYSSTKYMYVLQQTGINKPKRVFTKIAPDNQMFVPTTYQTKPKLISLKKKWR